MTFALESIFLWCNSGWKPTHFIRCINTICFTITYQSKLDTSSWSTLEIMWWAWAILWHAEISAVMLIIYQLAYVTTHAEFRWTINMVKTRMVLWNTCSIIAMNLIVFTFAFDIFSGKNRDCFACDRSNTFPLSNGWIRFYYDTEMLVIAYNFSIWCL